VVDIKEAKKMGTARRFWAWIVQVVAKKIPLTTPPTQRQKSLTTLAEQHHLPLHNRERIYTCWLQQQWQHEQHQYQCQQL
jgi:hypothetical protein